MLERKRRDASTLDEQSRGNADPASRLAPTLTIVSHPLASRAGEQCRLEALLAGREVHLSRNAPDFVPPGARLGEPLDDLFLSRKPLIFSPASGGRIRLLIQEGGMKVVVGEPIGPGIRELEPEALASGLPIELSDRVVLLLHLDEPNAEGAVPSLDMVGQSAAIRRVRRDVEQVADLDVSVLIRGETGTGKELVAQSIHQRSPRRGGPFVSVNLGALPRELAAAELFGAVKGAYTGANRDREGLFQAAHGGTLFLDEVGEAPPELQAMLLRVLETRELYPVGGHSPVATNVRVVAATDANLEAQIRDGRFKAPLLHRLAGYEIRLPPLRERRADIGVLLHHFARQELEALGEAALLEPTDPRAPPWLPASLAARLVRHAWPGNIRQLRNLTRQLVISSRGKPQLHLDPRLAPELEGAVTPLPPGMLAAPAPPARDATEAGPAVWRKPSEVTEPELLAALRESAWDLKAAANRLGISRASLYVLIDKSPGIRRAADLDPEEITRCFRECQGDLDAMAQRLEVSRRALNRRVKELGLEPGDD